MSETNRGNGKSSYEPHEDSPGQLTPKQVARAIGVSESSVKRWCDAGLIESTHTSGGHRRLSLESVQKFLKEKNHLEIDPDIFSLKFSLGKSEYALERGKKNFIEAMLSASEVKMKQIVLDYLDSGHKLEVIFDQILFAARADVRQLIRERKIESPIDHLGTEICLRLMFELRAGFDPPPSTAPRALTVGLDGSPDPLRIEAAEVLLYLQGWNVRAVGCHIPFQQLETIIREDQPDLIYLDVEEIRNQELFFGALAHLKQTAEEHQVLLFLGGSTEVDQQRMKSLQLNYVKNFESLIKKTLKERKRLRG